MKCGCPWKITFRNCYKDYSTLSDKDSHPMEIINVDPNHKFPCQPGRSQFLFVKTRSGKFVDAKTHAVHHVIRHMLVQTNGFASSQFIRNVMRKAIPQYKSISPQDVYNVRIRAKMLMKHIKEKG